MGMLRTTQEAAGNCVGTHAVGSSKQQPDGNVTHYTEAHTLLMAAHVEHLH